jgi:hypothetical protein
VVHAGSRAASVARDYAGRGQVVLAHEPADLRQLA